MYSIGDSVKITVARKNILPGFVGVVKGVTEKPDPEGEGFKNHYLVQGCGFEEGYLFTAEELELWELPIERKKLMSVEELWNLKKDAEGKINDILETLGKDLSPMADIDSITLSEIRPVDGKRYNTKVKIIVS